MGKITWNDRANSGEDSKISASIFNETKESVNSVYDIVQSTSSASPAITASIISLSGPTDDFNVIGYSASFQHVTASNLFVDDNTLYIGGSPFSKTDVDSLKSGKSVRKDGKQIVNEVDSSTYVKMNSTGSVDHFVSNIRLMKLVTSSVELGHGKVPVKLVSNNLQLTGSATTSISSSNVYTTTNLLTLLGNFGQTGSFAVTGSSSFTGDVNMDGIVTTQDLLQVVAGMTTTGSINASGSTSQTGSFNNSGSFTNEGTGSFTGSVESTGSIIHTGSSTMLPPPMIPGSGPITRTLYYGYLFSGGTPDPMQVQATASYDPNAINYFRFSTSSQQAYNDLVETNKTHFFTGLAASASNQQFADLTFTPTVGYPSHSYHFKVNTAAITGSYSQVSVTFIGSSSLVGGAAPTFIEQSGGGANGRWKFVIPPPALEQPTGGFNVGDLLNVLSAFGESGVETGSMGDFNFDGNVNVTDLMTVLSGMGNGNVICGQDVLIPQGTNHQLIGPVISVCPGNVYIIAEGSFSSITI